MADIHDAHGKRLGEARGRYVRTMADVEKIGDEDERFRAAQDAAARYDRDVKLADDGLNAALDAEGSDG